MHRKLFIVLTIIFLSACSTIHGLKPLSPSFHDETKEIKPHFQWEPSQNEGVKYDFAIFELVYKGQIATPGKTIYYKEGLDVPEHTIDIELNKGVTYLWSVRVRDKETVEPWSKYDFTAYWVFGYVIQKNHLFHLEIIDPNKKVKDPPG